MASPSNPSRVEGDVERGVGIVRPHDTSYTTKVVQDITYKAIPVCGFCLVVFSVGAILESTLAFNKPVPHRAAIVVSAMLLSLSLLFFIGIIYLYFRKSRPRVSKRSNYPNLAPQTVYRLGFHPWEYVKNVAHRVMRLSSGVISYSSSETTHAAPQSVRDGRIQTDTLRDPAPSPNTYRRETEQQRDVAQEQDTPCEIRGTGHQRDHQLPQQREYQADGSSRAGLSNPVRQGGPEADQFPSNRGGNRPMPMNIATTPYPNQTQPNPHIRPTQGNPIGLPAGRAPARPSTALVRENYQIRGPREIVRKPTPQQRRRDRPRDAHREGISHQAPPPLSLDALVPPLPSSPEPTRTRTRQLRGAIGGAQFGSTPLPRPQTGSGERRRHGHLYDGLAWPHAPVAGFQSQESLRSVIQHYGYPNIGNLSLSSIQASWDSETEKSKRKKQSPYIANDMAEFATMLRSLPLSQGRELEAVEPSAQFTSM
ncbi:hypothetical protein GGS24DRAFT_502357 [Hypoxylon argillaceum]|nr:hypothetical protein GGS24DRAFT_502357 [Hypoxylon argillaceum]